MGCVYRQGGTIMGQTWYTSSTLPEGSESLLSTLKEDSLEIPQSPEHQLLNAPSCLRNPRDSLLWWTGKMVLEVTPLEKNRRARLS